MEPQPARQALRGPRPLPRCVAIRFRLLTGLVLLLAAPAWCQTSAPPAAKRSEPIGGNAILQLDQSVNRWATTEKPLGSATHVATFLASGTGLALAFAASFMDRNGSDSSLDGAFAKGCAADGLLTVALKTLVGRERPDHSAKNSWPSGDVSIVVTALTVLDAHFGARSHTALPFAAVGAFVALSRIQMNRHWLSDTLAGATLGYASGRFGRGDISAAQLGLVAGGLYLAGKLINRKQVEHQPAEPLAIAPEDIDLQQETGMRVQPSIVLWASSF